MAEFDHFDTFPGRVGGAKLRLKPNSAQLKLKLGLSLAIERFALSKVCYQLSTTDIKVKVMVKETLMVCR